MKELLKIARRYGLPYGSLGVMTWHFDNLRRDGLSMEQIYRAMENLHPVLASNLAFDEEGRISVKDESLRWIRRSGWTAQKG